MNVDGLGANDRRFLFEVSLRSRGALSEAERSAFGVAPVSRSGKRDLVQPSLHAAIAPEHADQRGPIPASLRLRCFSRNSFCHGRSHGRLRLWLAAKNVTHLAKTWRLHRATSGPYRPAFATIRARLQGTLLTCTVVRGRAFLSLARERAR